MRLKSDGTRTNVPVEINGSVVGGARVTPEGAIEIIVFPNTLSRELAEKIAKGYAGGIRLEPKTE